MRTILLLLALLLAGCSGTAATPASTAAPVTPTPDPWPQAYWLGVCGAVATLTTVSGNLQYLMTADRTQQIGLLASLIEDDAGSAAESLTELPDWKPGASAVVYLRSAAEYMERAGALIRKAAQTGNRQYRTSAGAALEKATYQMTRAAGTFAVLLDRFGFDCTPN